MTNLKTLKDILEEDRELSGPLTPENGKDYDYSKGEPKHHTAYKINKEKLQETAREWANKIIKDMVIDSSKIGPITINEQGILTIEIDGLTSNHRAQDQAIGMLAFLKHFFNLEEP